MSWQTDLVERLAGKIQCQTCLEYRLPVDFYYVFMWTEQEGSRQEINPRKCWLCIDKEITRADTWAG